MGLTSVHPAGSASAFSPPTAAMVGKKRVSMLVVDKDKESAACPICYGLLEDPTQGCSEGHTFCGDCYREWLRTNQNCPTCRRSTDESRCKPLRCPHLPEPDRCDHAPSGKDAEAMPDTQLIAGCRRTARSRTSFRGWNRAARTGRTRAKNWTTGARGKGLWAILTGT